MSLLEKIFCISSTKNKDEQILNIAWLFSCADRPRQMNRIKSWQQQKLSSSFLNVQCQVKMNSG